MTVGFVALAVGACSFVRFEKGPYVVRDLHVVYSAQEDMTFFSWQVRQDADLGRASFELYRGGSFETIDLSKAPFPAEPYDCRGDRICLQYQVPGHYTVPADTSPVRSRHVDEGVYAGPAPDIQDVETTIGIDPVALGDNEKIDPKLDDWFAQNGVPMRRQWQWQFVRAGGTAPCEETSAGDWAVMEDIVAVAQGWYDPPRCFAARPDRRDGAGRTVKARIPASAETRFTRQTYVPDRVKTPIVYGILVDMEIPSEQRCKQVRERLVDKVQSEIAGRGMVRNLGVFTPISAQTGKPLDGCNQESRRSYPLEGMVRRAKEAANTLSPPKVRILWVYINNIDLTPESQIANALRELTGPLATDNDLNFFNWAIGSNTILQSGNWDERTGWRPIENDTFRADIESFAKNHLPFVTMGHESDRELAIGLPKGVSDPVAFKICQSTPVPVRSIGLESGRPIYGINDPHVPWPETGRPYYQVSLSPQDRVAKQAYVKRRVDIVVEVCERFCDHPFQTRGGSVYDNWKKTPGPRAMEVCQWRK